METGMNTEQLKKFHDEMFRYGAHLMMNENKSAEEAKNALIEKGLDEETALEFSVDIEYQMKLQKIDNNDAKKNMLYGALWCIGGTVATLADFGYIFWGAIVFGAIQFVKGTLDWK